MYSLSLICKRQPRTPTELARGGVLYSWDWCLTQPALPPSGPSGATTFIPVKPVTTSCATTILSYLDKEGFETRKKLPSPVQKNQNQRESVLLDMIGVYVCLFLERVRQNHYYYVSYSCLNTPRTQALSFKKNIGQQLSTTNCTFFCFPLFMVSSFRRMHPIRIHQLLFSSRQCHFQMVLHPIQIP